MGRREVDLEMQQMLGGLLSALDRVPDELVDSEWDLLKRVVFGETLIPSKYKELIGLAVAAMTRCPYGIALHGEMARLYGATEAEVAEAVHYARIVSGWGVHLAGLGVDPGQFTVEVSRAVAHFADRLSR